MLMKNCELAIANLRMILVWKIGLEAHVFNDISS